MRGAKGLAVSKSHPLDKKSEDMHLKWPIMRERERERKRCKKLLFLKVIFLGPFLWASRPYDQNMAIFFRKKLNKIL
jgi:hypothetical protein